MFYPYRFFVARGESLRKIEELQAEREQANDAAETYRKHIGATEINTVLDPSARFEHGAPAGWKIEFHHDSTYVPDLDTPEGRKADAALRELGQMPYPQIRFAKWLGQYEVDTAPDEKEIRKLYKQSASFEKVGTDYIIHVPVVTRNGFDPALGTMSAQHDDWITPPDAEPIKVSEYFNRLEQAGKLLNTPHRDRHTSREAEKKHTKKHSQPGIKPA